MIPTIRRVGMFFLMLAMIGVLAVPSAIAAPRAIGDSDMSVTLKKTKFNYLTEGLSQIEKITGSKVKELDTSASAKYELSTKYGVFRSSTRDGFVEYSTLSADVSTARGIKVGSTQEKMLEVYPTPTQKWTEKKVTTYVFQAPIPKDTDFSNISKKRPLSYYGIVIEVSDTTNKVLSVSINNCTAN